MTCRCATTTCSLITGATTTSARRSFRRATTSSWATTGTAAPTAGTGAWFRRSTSSARCRSAGGRSPTPASSEYDRLRRSPRAPVMPAPASTLLDEANLPDHHLAVSGLQHVVDGERRRRDRGHRFHLDACLRG